MSESTCKGCGERLVWVGGLADGRLECPTCRLAEHLGESIELSRLRDEETGEDVSVWAPRFNVLE